MVDVVSPFPLLNLPNNALMHVLRSTDIVPIIGLSILSKRTKNLVKSLKLETEYFTVNIKDVIRVCVSVSNIQSWTFNVEDNRNIPARANDPPAKLPIPYSVKLECYKGRDEQEIYEWNNEKMEIKEWIDHLLSIFNRSKISNISFEEGCDRYDVELLRNLFNDYMTIWISFGCSDAYAKQILKTFLPVKRIFLNKNPFEKREDIHNVLIQNFVHLTFCNSLFLNWPNFELNDLLMINSMGIRLSNAKLSNKELNGFIKHWIDGSNPRMTYLEVNFLYGRVRDEALDENVILKGVSYTILPQEQERAYISLLGSINAVINGGSDFTRNDGTNATIVIEQSRIRMFVWH